MVSRGQLCRYLWKNGSAAHYMIHDLSKHLSDVVVASIAGCKHIRMFVFVNVHHNKSRDKEQGCAF